MTSTVATSTTVDTNDAPKPWQITSAMIATINSQLNEINSMLLTIQQHHSPIVHSSSSTIIDEIPVALPSDDNSSASIHSSIMAIPSISSTTSSSAVMVPLPVVISSTLNIGDVDNDNRMIPLTNVVDSIEELTNNGDDIHILSDDTNSCADDPLDNDHITSMLLPIADFTTQTHITPRDIHSIDAIPIIQLNSDVILIGDSSHVTLTRSFLHENHSILSAVKLLHDSNQFSLINIEDSSSMINMIHLNFIIASIQSKQQDYSAQMRFLYHFSSLKLFYPPPLMYFPLLLTHCIIGRPPD